MWAMILRSNFLPTLILPLPGEKQRTLSLPPQLRELSSGAGGGETGICVSFELSVLRYAHFK